MNKKELEKQADELMRLARESGLASNYLFSTTFNRYKVQLAILDKLEEAIKSSGMFVEKEYVRGSKNLYSNPAVSDYNRTTDSANKTVSTLMRIIKNFESEREETDPLSEMIDA